MLGECKLRSSLCRLGVSALAFAFSAALADGEQPGGSSPPKKFRSPEAVRFSPDGKRLAVADRTFGELVFVDLDPDLASSRIASRVALCAEPSAVVWSRDGKRLWVSERGAGSVAEVDAAESRVLRRFPVGRSPVGIAVSEASQRLVAADADLDSVAVVDLSAGAVRGRIPVSRRPLYLALDDEGICASSRTPCRTNLRRIPPRARW